MSWLYTVTLYPLEFLYKQAYLLCVTFTGSYGAALMALSLCTVVAFMPLKRLVKGVLDEERNIQDVLLPKLQKIKEQYQGAERHEHIKKLYRRYSYTPLMAVRSGLNLLLQVPFLMAAYYMISGLTALQGHSFLFIKDLSQPDGLLNGVNLLPIVMTLVNVVTAFTSKDMRGKDRLQAMVVALLFLWLLYGAPSALLFYWTCNNVIYLVQNIIDFLHKPSPITFSSFNHNMWLLCSTNMKRLNEGVSFAGVMFAFILLQTGCMCFINYPNIAVKDFLPVQVFALVSLCICAASTLNLPKGKAALGFVIFMGIIAVNVFTLITNVPYSMTSCVLFADMITIIEYGRIMKSEREKSLYDGVASIDILLLLTAATAGIAFQASNNLQYILSLNSLIYFACIVFAFLFIAAIFVWHISFAVMPLGRYARICLAFFLSWLFLPTVQALLSLYEKTNITFTLLFFCTTTLIFFIAKTHHGRKYLLIILCIFTATSSFMLTKESIVQREAEKAIAFTDKRMDIMQGLARKHEGGVYSLVYDAIPDIKTLRALGVDSTRLEGILNKYGFKIYPDTYSLGWGSLLSQGLTFSILEHKKYPLGYDPRKACSGESIVFSIMKKLKYDIKNFQNAYMLGGFTTKGIEYLPQFNNELLREKTMLSVLICGLLEGEFKFDQDGKMLPLRFKIKEISDMEALRLSPRGGFVVCHFRYPGHSQNSGKLLPNETELYLNRLKKALDQMDTDLKTILDHDPNAIIIVYGDHGPYLTGDGVGLKDYELSEVSELMIRDRIGTLVSIKWPNLDRARKYDHALRVNQDIFPVIFSYICNSDKPLQLLIKNTKGYFEWETKWQNHVFIDGGIFQKVK